MIVLAVVLAVLVASAGAVSPDPEVSLPTDAETALEPFEASATATHYVALLMKGPRWREEDTAERRELRQRRRRHLRALAGAGYLIAAGPVPGRGQVRGILLLRASSLTAAHVLVAQDPAVKAGRLVVEVHPWVVAKPVFQDRGLEPDDAPGSDDQALVN